MLGTSGTSLEVAIKKFLITNCTEFSEYSRRNTSHSSCFWLGQSDDSLYNCDGFAKEHVSCDSLPPCVPSCRQFWSAPRVENSRGLKTASWSWLSSHGWDCGRPDNPCQHHALHLSPAGRAAHTPCDCNTAELATVRHTLGSAAHVACHSYVSYHVCRMGLQ